MINCLDCGIPEDDLPSDFWLPREQWLMIMPPDGSGILCLNCTLKRISKLPNVARVELGIVFKGDPRDIAPPVHFLKSF